MRPSRRIARKPVWCSRAVAPIARTTRPGLNRRTAPWSGVPLVTGATAVLQAGRQGSRWCADQEEVSPARHAVSAPAGGHPDQRGRAGPGQHDLRDPGPCSAAEGHPRGSGTPGRNRRPSGHGRNGSRLSHGRLRGNCSSGCKKRIPVSSPTGSSGRYSAGRKHGGMRWRTRWYGPTPVSWSVEYLGSGGVI